jgi:hypothetical protein
VRRRRAVTVGVAMVVFVGVRMGMSHSEMLYYNITDVYEPSRSLPKSYLSKSADGPRDGTAEQ